MSDSPALEVYFAEASGWDRERAAAAERSVRTAWWVAGAGWICALTSGAALALLMPLKRVEPFLIRVDRSTGVVDVVPMYAGRATQPEAVTRYFLTHYVTVCRRFNYATAESDYEECGAFQTPKQNQAWYALWTRSNPASPLNLHKDGSTVRVRVESVSFFEPSGGLGDFAQIRYVTVTRDADGSAQKSAHFIATVRYVYTAPSADPRVRRWNPLGFKIVEFQAEPELLGESTDAAKAVAAGVKP